LATHPLILIIITFISPFVSVNSLVFLLLLIPNFHSLFRLVMIPLHSSSSQSVFPLMASLSLLLLLSASCLAMASAYEDSFDAGFPLEAFQKRRGRELFGKRSSGGAGGSSICECHKSMHIIIPNLRNGTAITQNERIIWQTGSSSSTD
jgi:hypothetical protein